LIEEDEPNNKVYIRDDRNRSSWFPKYCFVENEASLFTLEDFTLDDPIRDPYCDSIEVTIQVRYQSVSQKRWCYFLTPAYIYRMFYPNQGEPIVLGKQGIILPELSETSIRMALSYFELNNLLEEYTLPLEE